MKNRTRFIKWWSGFFAGLFTISFVVLLITNNVFNGVYSSKKTEAVIKADSTLKQLSQKDLMLKTDSLFSGKISSESDKDLKLKAENSLKSGNPIFYYVIFEHNIYWLMLLFPFIAWRLYLKSRLAVQPEWNLIAEWKKQKMEPFTPGWHYPFRYFGFFEEIADVPMNKQSLCILSGVRDGFEETILDEYVYGTASNMEPGTGDFLRLLYKVEIKCFDSILTTYNVEDPYEYIASLVELCVGRYVHKNSSEKIIDKFSKQKLSIIPISILEQIKTDTGIEIISFIPVDVVNTPETEVFRRTLDQKTRQKDINAIDLKNRVQLEKGEGEVLQVKLANADIENQIRANKLKSIMEKTSVSGEEALKIVMKDKTLETIAKASESGSIVYIDESNGNNSLNQGASLGFAINATNNQKKP